MLNTLASQHSRRSYEYAIERFIAWYCSEPRLTFNRSVVVKYRSFLECLSLSTATINLHLSAIRRLADESAESGWLSPEHAIGIRRVKGVKRLGPLKRCARQAGISNLAPQRYIGSKQKLQDAVNDRLGISVASDAA